MSAVLIRVEGKAGRITLNRPDALNALNYAMCREIDAALKRWRDDPAVALVVIDAAGRRAFCAGGDVAELYTHGAAGDHAYGQRFWRDEYRMNARIGGYPKPVVALMQGFCMGGGVGLGGHASHRIVGESSQISMPECGIGLVPDVGGSALLARAPGRLGYWLGTTGSRMGPGDAIHAGFADHFLPEADWPALLADLVTGRLKIPAHPAPESNLPALRDEIDAAFGPSLPETLDRLRASRTTFAAETVKVLSRQSPLSLACTVEMLNRLGPAPALRTALELEYRFTYRAQAESDFLEGVRAALIDKDRAPRWRDAQAPVPPEAVARLLGPLGAETLTFEEDSA